MVQKNMKSQGKTGDKRRRCCCRDRMDTRTPLPGQRHLAVEGRSPEAQELKEGVSEDTAPLLGHILGSKALWLLQGIGTEAQPFPMLQMPPQPREEPSSIGEGRKCPAFCQRVRALGKLQCHMAGDAQGGNTLTKALGTKPAPRVLQGPMHFPALQTWRQLGRFPGGQGNAFSRQISRERLSLPVASHTLILALLCVSLLV